MDKQSAKDAILDVLIPNTMSPEVHAMSILDDILDDYKECVLRDYVEDVVTNARRSVVAWLEKRGQ